MTNEHDIQQFERRQRQQVRALAAWLTITVAAIFWLGVYHGVRYIVALFDVPM